MDGGRKEEEEGMNQLGQRTRHIVVNGDYAHAEGRGGGQRGAVGGRREERGHHWIAMCGLKRVVRESKKPSDDADAAAAAVVGHASTR
jgi:hypothetical protein